MASVFLFTIFKFKLGLLLFVNYFNLHGFVRAENLEGKVVISGYDMPCSYRCVNMESPTMEIMNDGHKLFLENSFLYALSNFHRAGDLQPENVDIIENTAECTTKLGYHYRTMDEADKILERQSSNCFPGVYYKAKALLGLQRFKEAIQLVTSVMSINDELKKSADLVNLLKKLHALEYQQRTGIYDMMKLIRNDVFNEDFADYVGPVEIKNIPGKGRGLIATEDIHAGQLLIVNKAFVISYPEDNDNSHLAGFSELVELAAIKLRVEPEHADWFYQSYAGPEMSFLTRYVDNDTVDYQRIEGICAHTNTIAEKNILSNSRNRRGLWILPSYMNHHGLDCNSFWLMYGDIIVVRSFKNISRGEELTVSYIDPDYTFEDRDYVCQQHGFQCTCSLCQADRKDSVEIREKRTHILNQLTTAKRNTRMLLSFVEELEKLRPDNPELNIYIIKPLYSAARNYYKNGHFTKSVDVLLKAHRIMTMKNRPLVAGAFKYSIAILNSYIALDNREEILRWIEILKQDLMAAYGSFEIFKFIQQDTLMFLNELGIKF